MKVLVLLSEKSKYKLAGILHELKEYYGDVRVLEIENESKRIKSRCRVASSIIVLYDNSFENYLISNMEEKSYITKIFTDVSSKIAMIHFDDRKKLNFSQIKNTLFCNINDFDNVKSTLNSIQNTIVLDKHQSLNKTDEHPIEQRKIIFISILLFICSLYLLSYKKFLFGTRMQYFLSITMLVTSMISLVICFLQSNKKISNLFFETEYIEYDEKIKRALVKDEADVEDKEEKINALGRMELNLSDIKEFYVWTKKQSKAAFVLANSLIIVGIITLIVSIVLSIYLKLETSVTIIGAVGGIIIEFIGATALVVYKTTLSQLNHYHRSLHEDERFLSSVNLINSLSDNKQKDEMIKQVINSELELNRIELEQYNKQKNNH